MIALLQMSGRMYQWKIYENAINIRSSCEVMKLGGLIFIGPPDAGATCVAAKVRTPDWQQHVEWHYTVLSTRQVKSPAVYTAIPDLLISEWVL